MFLAPKDLRDENETLFQTSVLTDGYTICSIYRIKLTLAKVIITGLNQRVISVFIVTEVLILLLWVNLTIRGRTVMGWC